MRKIPVKTLIERFSFSLPNRHFYLTVLVMASCCLLMGGSLSHGAELYTAPAWMNKSSLINIPIIIDQVNDLAGIKLIVTYDKDVLKFKEGQKTPISQSLMHIINDQKPGRLVIVLAGARGVSGKDISFINLIFTVEKPFKNPGSTKLEIPEVQLMTEQLKEIPCTVRAKTFLVSF
jgi:hypothetical protein